MKTLWIITVAVAVSLVAGLLVCRHVRDTGSVGLGQPHRADAATDAEASSEALRIGIVPERDIFAQRRRYRILMDYLETQIDRPIALVTMNTYQAILDDFAEREVDAAFLGSMVAVLTMDRLGAEVAVKPQIAGGVTTYRGVLFVRPESPVRSVGDLAGRTIAAVRTTTAGDLFAMYTCDQAGLLDGDPTPRFAWVGTHDDVMLEVMAGRVDAGSAKNLRLEAYEQSHGIRMRQLAQGPPVPNNALVLRADVADELGPLLSDALLSMHDTPIGRDALSAFGATRFVPCEGREYAVIYDMIAASGDVWSRMDIHGEPPQR